MSLGSSAKERQRKTRHSHFSHRNNKVQCQLLAPKHIQTNTNAVSNMKCEMCTNVLPQRFTELLDWQYLWALQQQNSHICAQASSVLSSSWFRNIWDNKVGHRSESFIICSQLAALANTLISVNSLVQVLLQISLWRETDGCVWAVNQSSPTETKRYFWISFKLRRHLSKIQQMIKQARKHLDVRNV